MNGGDQLARGARSATFGPPNVTKEKWDAIWSQDEDTKIDLYRPNEKGEHEKVKTNGE